MEQNAKTIDFIKKAQKVHNTKYDYSKVQYEKSSLKVTITCLMHGDFYQTPANHLKPSGCKECRNMKLRQERQKTLTEFVNECKEVHGHKYDYSKVEYINSNTKVIITCAVHGDFEQLPSSHLNGKGCALCYGNKKMTNEEFIRRAQDLHHNTYDYSKVNYKNSNSKVVITCVIHGEFEQIPLNHMKGHGCVLCGQSKRCDQLRSSSNEFIKKAKNIHHDRYNYDDVCYVKSNTHVIIKCTDHGEFMQSPANHLKGQGCPHCRYKTEFMVYKFLKDTFVNETIKKPFSQEWCKLQRCLPYDICMMNKNIIIEVDGKQHFQQVINWTCPSITQQRDKFKEACAKQNGYHIIRVYQEDVFQNEYDWRKALYEAVAYLETIVANYKIIYICDRNKNDIYEQKSSPTC